MPPIRLALVQNGADKFIGQPVSGRPATVFHARGNKITWMHCSSRSHPGGLARQ